MIPLAWTRLDLFKNPNSKTVPSTGEIKWFEVVSMNLADFVNSRVKNSLIDENLCKGSFVSLILIWVSFENKEKK